MNEKTAFIMYSGGFDSLALTMKEVQKIYNERLGR